MYSFCHHFWRIVLPAILFLIDRFFFSLSTLKVLSYSLLSSMNSVEKYDINFIEDSLYRTSHWIISIPINFKFTDAFLHALICYLKLLVRFHFSYWTFHLQNSFVFLFIIYISLFIFSICLCIALISISCLYFPLAIWVYLNK